MKRMLRWALLSVILLAIYLYATPYLFFYRFNQHLENKDYSALSKVVDFDAVHKSFELQIETKGKVSELILQKSVERYLTPEGLEELLSSPLLARKAARKELKSQLEQIKEDKKSLKKAMKQQLQQLRKDKRNSSDSEGFLKSQHRGSKSNKERQEAQLNYDSAKLNDDDTHIIYDLGYTDINRFTLDVHNHEEHFIQLVLYRSGISWKLSEVWLYFIFDKAEP